MKDNDATPKGDEKFGFNADSQNVTPKGEKEFSKADLSGENDISQLSEMKSESHRGEENPDKTERVKTDRSANDWQMEEKKKNENATVNHEEDPLKNPLPKEDSNLGDIVAPNELTAQKPESGRETAKVEEHPIEHKHHTHKRRASRKKTIEQV